MEAAFRKDGTDSYVLTESLANIGGPGRRKVRSLEIRGISREDRDSLQHLQEFRDLERLTLINCDGTDLAALTGLSLKQLVITDSRDLDFTAIQDIRGLDDTLALTGIHRCYVPDPFTLSSAIGNMVLAAAPGGNRDLDALICNIEWERHASLDILTVESQSSDIEGDTRFLRHLPNLWRLDWNMPPVTDPSPLRPPFDGLSKKLKSVEYATEGARRVEEQLFAYLGVDSADASVSVLIHDPSLAEAAFADLDDLDQVIAGPWEALQYEEPDSATGYGWSVYRSLADLWTQFDTENDAAKHAHRLLKKSDPKRSRKIEFDSESDGSSIIANELEDLEWALETLGVPREAD